MEFDNKQEALDFTMLMMLVGYKPGSESDTDANLKSAREYLMCCDGTNGDKANPRKLAAYKG